MNNKPFISIVIPVYNTENYLRNCLDSFLEQSFLDFEVLLINDGSTDGSSLICDEYVENHENFKVFHKINEGVSSARNLGIQESKGMYIFFVDSDDYILKDSLLFLNVKKELDLFMFKTSILKQGRINREDNIKVTLTNELWRYIFKRELIIENHLEFIDIRYGEDYNFIAKYFSLIKTKRFINQYVYVYRSDSEGSAMNKIKTISYILDHFVMIQDLSFFLSLNKAGVNRFIIKSAIKRGFKMILVVISKSLNLGINNEEIFFKYKELYSSVSRQVILYMYHPLFLRFWIKYYKMRLK